MEKQNKTKQSKNQKSEKIEKRKKKKKKKLNVVLQAREFLPWVINSWAIEHRGGKRWEIDEWQEGKRKGAIDGRDGMADLEIRCF